MTAPTLFPAELMSELKEGGYVGAPKEPQPVETVSAARVIEFPKPTLYVAGLMFSPFKPHSVALIRKNRPAWQKGRWNAIGGHIEAGETPIAAMRREFREETGVYQGDWDEFVVLSGDGFRVHFFSTFSRHLWDVYSTTDEKVGIFPVSALPDATLTNIPWLIQMALSMDRERASSFIIQEQYDNHIAA